VALVSGLDPSKKGFHLEFGKVSGYNRENMLQKNDQDGFSWWQNNVINIAQLAWLITYRYWFDTIWRRTME
jgi:hypothetical protein